MATLLLTDLADANSRDFNSWADSLHQNDQPWSPPSFSLPNPLEGIGQAVEQKRSDFLDWADSLNAPPLAPTVAVSPMGDARATDSASPVSPFLDWTQQVDRGISSPFTTVNSAPQSAIADSPPQPSLPHTEEPATATDALSPGDGGNRWKTQFDFGSTYTGDYRTGTPHRGIDLVPASGGGIGTEVDAFTPGTVTSISRDSGAGGLMVYVQDDQGLTHAYMHLANAAPGLAVGQRVNRGTPIATMGESGTEGSPHLHYEVRKNASTGDPLDQLIDPRPYLAGGTTSRETPGFTAPTTTGPLGRLQDYARQAAQRVGIDPDVFVRQIQQESGFDPSARSPAGAQGIAQIVPRYHPGVDTSDPLASLDYAAALMRQNLDRYGGDIARALAAYNAGAGAVDQYGGVPPFEETQRYVSTILGPGRGTDVLRGATDVLGQSQALLGQTAQNIGSGASQVAQRASGSFTDWLLEQRGTPNPTPAATPGGGYDPSALRPVEEPPQPDIPRVQYGTTAPATDTLGEAAQHVLDVGGDVLSGQYGMAEQAASARRTLEDIGSRYPHAPGERGWQDQMTPADRLEYDRALGDLLITVGGATGPVEAGRANWLDKGVAWTTSNMLSAPASLFTNATALSQNVTRPVITAATAALKAIGGDIPGARIELGAAGHDLLGQGAAFGDALADFGRTFARGKERPNVDIRAEAFPGASGMIATPALRLNAATDELVRSLGSAGAQAAELRRLLGQHPDLSREQILEQFGDRLAQIGADEAAHVGFETGGSGLGSVVSRWRNQLTRQGATVPERLAGAAAQVAVPFSHVPDVIGFRGLKDLPIANELISAGKAGQAAEAGDMSGARRVAAGSFLNSAVNLAIYTQVQQGNITGAGPSDPAKLAALKNARDENGNPIWRPNSIKIGDRWFQYGGLGPISVRMGAIANAVEQWELEGKKVDPDYLKAVGGATAETVTDFWYLQGISDVFNAMRTGNVSGAGERMLGSVGDRLVPLGGLANQVRQWTDPTVRDPQNAWEREFNRIPGLSQLVPPKIDPATGEPVQEPRDISNAFIRSTAPGEPDPVNEALAQHNLGAPDAPNTISRAGGTIQLTDDEQRRYRELSGPEVAKRVQAIIGSRGYDAQTDDAARKHQQRERLQHAISEGRDAGEAKLWATIPGPERQRRVNAYRAAEKRQAEPAVRLPGG